VHAETATGISGYTAPLIIQEETSLPDPDASTSLNVSWSFLSPETTSAHVERPLSHNATFLDPRGPEEKPEDWDQMQVGPEEVKNGLKAMLRILQTSCCLFYIFLVTVYQLQRDARYKAYLRLFL
jgi:hypothetical protein